MFNGAENFEDYILKIGGFARTLKVSDICFKNTLYQSFRAPCSYMVSDMEPSLQPYLAMNKRDYVKAVHKRLEPASSADLIYTQYKERSQKAFMTCTCVINLICLSALSQMEKHAYLKTS